MDFAIISTPVFIQCVTCEELFSSEEELAEHSSTHKENELVRINETENNTSSSKTANKWTANESLILIRTFGEKRDDYENPKKSKSTFWEEIQQASKLPFTGEQCKGRWNTMQTRWKKIKDHNRISGNSAKTYEFEDELEAAVGGKLNVTPEHLLESSQSSTSRKKNVYSKESLNSRSSPGGDEDEANPPKKNKKETVPKKAELLTWMKNNKKEEAKLRQAEEIAAERRHQENMGLMQEFLGVLKELIPKQ